MQKASKIVLLVIAFLAITAATNNAEALGMTDTGLQNVNIGSSIFVSPKPKSPPAKVKVTKKPILPKITQVYASDYTPRVASTPTTTPISTATPTPPPAANLDANKIFDMVNTYRTAQGLAAFEKANIEIQSLAQIRSVELIAEGANGTIHAGLYNRNLPYWIWENAKYGSDEAGTVAWWINSWLHRHSILGDYKYSALACTGNYCVQLFTSLVAK